MPATLDRQAFAKSRYTVQDLINFVLTYRRRHSFTNLPASYIPRIISQLVERNEILWTDSNTGKLTGVLTFKLVPELGLIFVVNTLTSNRQAIREFAFTVNVMWPQYRILAFRRGKLIMYKNSKRLLTKLSTLKGGF